MLNQKIIKICEQKLIYLNYSKNTIKVYLYYIEKFIINFPEQQIIHLNSSDFQQYLYEFKFTSNSQQNQIINAIKFLYEHGLNKKYSKVKFNRPRKEEKLPNIIPEDYLKNKLNNISNLKHKAIIQLTYSVALRLGDIQKIEISDIRSDDMKIRIREGKGKKDAYLPLTQKTLDVLREYYKKYKPTKLLFEGQNGKSKYSSTSLNNFVKKHFGNEYHFHNIRHSTATHLLDKDVDISFIKELLRHKDIKTTMIYLRITTKSLSKLPLY